MNRFRIFILSGVITALCSHFAWAGTINSISVDQENRTVVVSVQLSESSIDESQTETSFVDGIFDIVIYAGGDTSTPSDYEVLISFVVPECSEYSKISAVLYAPDGHDDILVTATMLTGVCDVGENNCQDLYDACLSCRADCMLLPFTLSWSCGEACKEATVCLDDLDECNALWDASVVEEIPAMTVQPVLKELVDTPQNIMVDCMPKTLNLKSKGEWVTCWVPPEGSLEEINADLITLTYKGDPESTVKVKKSDIKDGMLMVKFSRQELIELIGSASGATKIELTDGTFFGTFTINVIDPGKENKIQNTKRVKKAKKVQLAKKK